MLKRELKGSFILVYVESPLGVLNPCITLNCLFLLAYYAIKVVTVSNFGTSVLVRVFFVDAPVKINTDPQCFQVMTILE